MATLTGNVLTLVELAKRTNDGMMLAIAETLNKTNRILDDAPYVRANGATKHTTTRRLSLPTGSWRKLNQGISREASRTEQMVENIGMLESVSQVDAGLADLAEDPRALRLSEDMAFVEGMGQTLATALVYGTEDGAPEQINGLATRYNDLDLDNVHDNSGTGSDLSSIWIIQWGPDKVHLIYPKYSSTAGLTAEDNGKIWVTDPNDSTKQWEVWQTHFKAHTGLVVRDDRCVQRICNIETAGTSNIFDEDLLIAALRQMPQEGAGAVLYANMTILAQMDIAAKDKANVNYGPEDAFGRPAMYFRGIPVRQVDAISNEEDAVT